MGRLKNFIKKSKEDWALAKEHWKWKYDVGKQQAEDLKRKRQEKHERVPKE